MLVSINQGTDVVLSGTTLGCHKQNNWVMYDISSITPDIPSNATVFMAHVAMETL